MLTTRSLVTVDARTRSNPTCTLYTLNACREKKSSYLCWIGFDHRKKVVLSFLRQVNFGVSVMHMNRFNWLNVDCDGRNVVKRDSFTMHCISCVLSIWRYSLCVSYRTILIRHIVYTTHEKTIQKSNVKSEVKNKNQRNALPWCHHIRSLCVSIIASQYVWRRGYLFIVQILFSKYVRCVREPYIMMWLKNNSWLWLALSLSQSFFVSKLNWFVLTFFTTHFTLTIFVREEKQNSNTLTAQRASKICMRDKQHSRQHIIFHKDKHFVHFFFRASFLIK